MEGLLILVAMIVVLCGGCELLSRAIKRRNKP